MLRRLRLAASVFCLLACIALGALWRRSYTSSDGSWTGPPYASFNTARGYVVVNFTGNPLTDPIRFGELWERFDSDPLLRAVTPYPMPTPERAWWEQDSTFGFHYAEVLPGRTWINFPLWAPMLLACATALSLALGRPPRFSIRGALIATTAVAVGMGILHVCYR